MSSFIWGYIFGSVVTFFLIYMGYQWQERMYKDKILLIKYKGTLNKEIATQISNQVQSAIDNGYIIYDENLEITTVEVDNL